MICSHITTGQLTPFSLYRPVARFTNVFLHDWDGRQIWESRSDAGCSPNVKQTKESSHTGKSEETEALTSLLLWTLLWKTIINNDGVVTLDHRQTIKTLTVLVRNVRAAQSTGRRGADWGQTHVYELGVTHTHCSTANTRGDFSGFLHVGINFGTVWTKKHCKSRKPSDVTNEILTKYYW